MKRTLMKLVALLVAMVACTLPAIAQSDETAKSFHLLPHLADGDGWQSVLLVTNVSQSASHCTFNVYGVPLNRFREFSGVTAAGLTARFQLEGNGGYLTMAHEERIERWRQRLRDSRLLCSCRCTSHVCVVRRLGGADGNGHGIQFTGWHGLPVSGAAASGHTRICDRKRYQRRGLLPHCF